MSEGSGAVSLLADPEPFEAVLAGSEPGPLAVVGDPYAGREQVLDVAADRLDATRVRLRPGDGAARVGDALGGDGDGAGEAVVIDDCQHLYTRRVGGFEPLETALDMLAGTGRTVVTGWNRYAWAYLTAVRAVEPVFADSVEVGPASAEHLAELVLARYDAVPAFERDETDRAGAVSVRRYGIDIAGRTLSVPVPVPNVGAFRAAGPDEGVDPQDVVFERLALAADGNVGVATALWERQGTDAVRPSDIAVPESDVTLDRDEGFCLRVLLAKERLRRSELDALVDGSPDRVIARFVRAGIASPDGDEIRLNPTAVPAAIDDTERERFP